MDKDLAFQLLSLVMFLVFAVVAFGVQAYVSAVMLLASCMGGVSAIILLSQHRKNKMPYRVQLFQ